MRMVAPLQVGVCCADLDGLAAFYVRVLGFAQVDVIEVPAEKAAPTMLSDCAYRVCRLQSPYGERLKKRRGTKSWTCGRNPPLLLVIAPAEGACE